MKTKPIETTETWNVKVWTTSDGMRHQWESDANRHQQSLEDIKVKDTIIEKKFESPLFTDVISKTWIFIANEDIREYVLRKFAERRDNYYAINNSLFAKKKDVEIGDWVAFGYKNGEDGQEQDGIFTLRWIYNEMLEFANTINSETVEGKY